MILVKWKQKKRLKTLTEMPTGSNKISIKMKDLPTNYFAEQTVCNSETKFVDFVINNSVMIHNQLIKIK